MSRRINAAVAVLFGAQVAVNYIASASSLFPNTVSTMSFEHPTRITPASYAFSIWGVIYALLAGYFIRRVLSEDVPTRKGVDYFLVPLTCVLNATWIVVWCFGLVRVACAVLAGLWLCLAFIWIDMNLVAPVEITPINVTTRLAPFSLYFGWTTCAAIVNLAIVVPFTDVYSAIALASIVFFSIMTMTIAFDVFFSAGTVWALTAILVKANVKNDLNIRNLVAIAMSVIAGAFIARVAARVFQDIRASRTDDLKLRIDEKHAHDGDIPARF